MTDKYEKAINAACEKLRKVSPQFMIGVVTQNDNHPFMVAFSDHYNFNSQLTFILDSILEIARAEATDPHYCIKILNEALFQMEMKGILSNRLKRRERKERNKK